MNVTEVRIRLAPNAGVLKAFAEVVLDGELIIHDLRILGKDEIFVAFPSRKIADRCHDCGNKNHLLARYCNFCGIELDDDRVRRDGEGRQVLFADTVHPITQEARLRIVNFVLLEYKRVVEQGETA